MTDTMTTEEYREYLRTTKLPARFAGQKTPAQIAIAAAERAVEEGIPVRGHSVERAARQMPAAKRELEEYLEYGPWGRVEREYRFHPERKWRADYALIDQRPIVLIEYDGLMVKGDAKDGGASNVGHASVSGIMRDQEKANAAIAKGFKYFRANAKTIVSGEFFTLLNDVLREIRREEEEVDAQ